MGITPQGEIIHKRNGSDSFDKEYMHEILA